jgi:2-polyprenyl-6-methoxyphenol hydroxylase-like FAD-dependent oxidoreductase
LADILAKYMDKNVLISGGGIAGLTLGGLLHEKGWEPLIIERDPALRTEGYMMDFFGTGWDVAERIGIIDSLRSISYPIDYMEYVDESGKPFLSMSIDLVRRALNGKYEYLRRSDLEKILYEWILSLGINVRFSSSVKTLNDTGSEVHVEFEDGSTNNFAFVFGADGVHSNIREIVFGPEKQFERFLGYYIAAFHTSNQYGIGRSLKIYEESNKIALFYPLNDKLMDANYIFRHPNVGFVPPDQQLSLVKKQYNDMRGMAKTVLQDLRFDIRLFFDSFVQIIMPNWSNGRIALLGDACGCLTPIAGQGSHMAMAGAYVLASELERHNGKHREAFNAYEKFLKPFISKKQKEAMKLSKTFVPSPDSNMTLRHIAIRILFSHIFLKHGLSRFGSKSILKKYYY